MHSNRITQKDSTRFLLDFLISTKHNCELVHFVLTLTLPVERKCCAMLERYIKSAGTLWRYRIGPFGNYIDALAAEFHENGYSPHTARILLRNISHLSHYLFWRGIGHVEDLRPEHVEAFFKEHLPHCSCEGPNSGTFPAAPSAVDHIINYLGAQGVLQGFGPVEVPPDSVAGILIRYDKYLEKIRGMSQKSRNLHRRDIKRFLDARYNRLGDLKLAELTAAEVLNYVRESLATPYSSATKSVILNCLRRFLRFLCWERIQGCDLSRAVPSVRRWKLATVPKHLPAEQVRVLLNNPRSDTPIGQRDRAILMLLAMLGLRAGEVTALKLDHVHWREGRLTVPRAKMARQRSLPLPPQVAEALCLYLQHGRPKTRSRTIFLRRHAPVKPLSSSQVGTIVRTHMFQAGIKEPPAMGSHVLRHSLATCLVNEGVPLKQIADILGHVNIVSTSIYAKVDVRRLSEVPFPFPKIKIKTR